jgi:LacI family transcriptional regulator
MPRPPDALFKDNNRITIGALRGMQAVARSVSLVGFDEVGLSDVLGLTVVSGDAQALGLGRAAIDQLYARNGSDEQPPRVMRIEPHLEIRSRGGTSAPGGIAASTANSTGREPLSTS